MPPTSRAMEAMEMSSVSSVWLASICALMISSGRRMLKSSSSPGRMWWRWRSSSVISFTTGFTASGETAEQRMSSSQVWFLPRMRFCAVLQGSKMVSS